MQAQLRRRLAADPAKVLEGLQPSNLPQPGRQRPAYKLGAQRPIPEQLDEHVVDDRLGLGRPRIAGGLSQQHGPVRDIDCPNHGFVPGMKCLQVNPGPPIRLRRLHESSSLMSHGLKK